MNNNTPYKAKAMTACNPMGYGHSGEISTIVEAGSTKPANKPSKIGVSGALVDGPYGGKKPVG